MKKSVHLEGLESMSEIFTHIYDINYWGSPDEYVGSGEGSSLSLNSETYNPFVVKFIEKHSIKSVLDLACGDWQSTHDIYSRLKTSVDYLGVDIVKSVIEKNILRYPEYKFEQRDITRVDTLPQADLWIIKDVLQHWCNDEIKNFLNKIIELSPCKWLLICNCCFQQFDNQDCPTGEWRPLLSRMEPLSLYGAESLYYYSTKEVSVIKMEK